MTSVVLDTDVSSRILRRRLAAPLAGRLSGMELAASCLAHELPLATFNTKDFLDLADHEGLTLLTS